MSILSGSISVASFASVIGAPTGIIEASCAFTFSITSGFVKKFLKTIRNEKKKHNEIVMLARSKLNSIESKISKALMNNEINQLSITKEYRELRESIRMMNSQRSNAEKVNLIEEGKETGINEVIRYNEIINNSLK